MDTIKIDTTISVPIEKVWKYYTQPEHITKWNFANTDWQCPSASNELKVGGKYATRMEAKDGSFGFDFEGIYTEVIIGEGLVYQLPDSRNVAIEFHKINDDTKVVIVFDAENENPIEMQKAGWQAILNNFKSYVETNQG